MKIMSITHPHWIPFIIKMQQLDPEGGCKHNYEHAIETLNTIPDVDINGSLEYFFDNGGHCDCEIIFNIILPIFDKD